MRTLRRHLLQAALALAALAAGAGMALAGTGGYDLSWDTLSPGGPASDGAYALESAVQAGAGPMGGGGYVLDGGYLPPALAGAEAPLLRTYLPAINR